ncbi:LOG family protein [Actibacterium pelagium]|uniref:Cytokinin riboside 5'-monophosphate phosphoribohydrolase n=1 Tax=Actibacterium pelagium TaxID=2029103 RepID=A0A917ABM5_9RHOB|nr:TIGR00730 family Rossman fold protein [Actibacterium pelagium]GGE40080.1 cytokinin riboside 5'-monophosphate phosphoribohydrolase [Actibacterium pelagium]
MVNNPYSICVFCGSRDGGKPAYAEAAEQFGSAIAHKGWRLVYGAGDVGLMGRIARAAQGSSAQTFGVIPIHLFEREVGKRDLSTFVITENMHERKKVMYMNSDAIVVMPGGAGTLDEFFEILTWRQLALHNKPIVLLNIEGFWDPLLSLINHVIAEGFAEQDIRDFIQVADDVPALVDLLSKAST